MEYKETKDEIYHAVKKLKILMYNYKNMLDKELGAAGWPKDGESDPNELFRFTKRSCEIQMWIRQLEHMDIDRTIFN